METIDEIEKSLQEVQPQGKQFSDFKPGDRIRVQIKFKEGEEIRKQRFDGVVISRRGHGLRETFTVRKVISGCGVERIFPLHSPVIEKLEVLKHGKVRRAKLYYLRNKK